MTEPDVILEIALDQAGLQRPCPDDESAIENLVKSAIPLSEAARAKAICFNRPDFNDVNVLSVGLWVDAGQATDLQLKDALVAAEPLNPEQGNAALLFTTTGIQNIASANWQTKNKKFDIPVGFARLSNDINVTVEDNQIVTKINGEWKIPGPNISFTYTARDLLNLPKPPPTDPRPPQLEVTDNQSITISGVAKLVTGAIIAHISPLLGGFVFWQADNLAGDLVPFPKEGGVGEQLAAQWPTEIMTKIAPPTLLGKITFFWTDLMLDGRGVWTVGNVILDQRSPGVAIEGPATVTAELPVNSGRATYDFTTSDLRGDLAIQWQIDGTQAGRASQQVVEFQSSRGTADPAKVYRQLQVDVHDADGLLATGKMKVELDVIVPPGKQQS